MLFTPNESNETTKNNKIPPSLPFQLIFSFSSDPDVRSVRSLQKHETDRPQKTFPDSLFPLARHHKISERNLRDPKKL
jgi:hypothetical protein